MAALEHAVTERQPVDREEEDELLTGAGRGCWALETGEVDDTSE